MDELDLMQIPPSVDVGSHTLNVGVREHPDGVAVELRHPDVGSRKYRVMNEAVVADAAGVLAWIQMVAPAVQHRLDAELRLRMRNAGYRA